MKASIEFLALLGSFLAGASPTAADPLQYPKGPIRIVVALSAGSTADATARAIAAPLSRTLGQPVIVENKPGADGAIAAEAVRTATPDGSILLLGQSTAMVGVPLTRKRPPYDPRTDFTPVSFIGRFTTGLFARPDIPAQTLADVVTYARSNPGKLSYATNSVTEAIVGAQIAKSAGITMVRVPYRGPAAVLPDLLAGRLQLAFISASAGLPYVGDGRLRALATLLPRRSPALPDVPTFIEAGYPNVTITPWFGFFGPPNMPTGIGERLSHEINILLDQPEIRTQLGRQLVEAQASTPEALLTFVKQEMESWQRAVRESGIELE
jgi:tripartite-type tricarboxylate transporter receptor subunit TctC